MKDAETFQEKTLRVKTEALIQNCIVQCGPKEHIYLNQLEVVFDNEGDFLYFHILGEAFDHWSMWDRKALIKKLEDIGGSDSRSGQKSFLKKQLEDILLNLRSLKGKEFNPYRSLERLYRSFWETENDTNRLVFRIKKINE